MWKMRMFVSVACVGAWLVLVGGCKRERDERAGTTTVTSAAVRASIDGAVERLAHARCERQVTCDELPESRQQAATETCRGLAKIELAQKLNAETCPRGVDWDRVATCEAAMMHGGCYDPIDALMRIDDCRASRLCL